MENIQKQPSGSYRIRWYDEYGVRKSTTLDTYAEAKQFLSRKELEVEIERKRIKLGLPPKRTFKALCDDYEATAQPLKKDRASTVVFVGLLGYIDGEMTLEYLQEHIQEISDGYQKHKRDQGLSQKTIVNHLTQLSILLNYAFKKKWLDKRTSVPKPKIRLIAEDFCYLKNNEEIKQFLNAAKEEEESDFIYTLYAFAVFTGARQGEICGLTWNKIDFEKRLITIDRSHQGTTKAGEVHYVPILDALLPILDKWKEINKENLTGYVFKSPRSENPLVHGSRYFKEIFHRVLKRAKFPESNRSRSKYYICFHDLRHTFASLWVGNGGDIYKLSKILGHQNITMTQRYSHLSPDKFKEDHSRIKF